MGRLVAAVRRHGVRGFVRSVRERAVLAVWLTELHVWFDLPVASVTPPVFEPPLTIGVARPDELADVEQVGRSRYDAERMAADGHDLWFVRDGDRVAFACWIHRGRAPVHAHADRWLPLPDGVVCLEDSVTAESHRGQRIAPRAWSHIATTLAVEGVEAMITKVEMTNIASRKACERAGFVGAALMDFRRRGRAERVRIQVLEEPRGGQLRERLRRG